MISNNTLLMKRRKMMSNRMNRREFMKLAGLTGAGLALAGCKPAATPTAAPTLASTATTGKRTFKKNKLTVALGWGPYEIEAADKCFKEKFTKETGIEVALEYVPGDSFDAKVYTNLLSDTPYDVISVGSGWVPPALSKGVIMPLNDLIDRDQFDYSNIVPAAVDSWVYDGKIYGLPADLYGFHTYFNVDLFEKAGLKPPAPTEEWTWDQLRDLAKKLTIRNGDQITQYGLGNQTDWMWDVWPNMNGAFLFEEGMKSAKLSDPAVIEAFEFYRSLIWDDKTALRFGAVQGSIEDLFIAGQIAILFDGTWTTGYLRSKKADMKYKWDVGLLPKGPSATKHYTPSDTGAWVLPAVAQDVDASWEVIKFQDGDAFAQEVMFNALSGLPCTKTALAGAWYAQWPDNPPEGQTKEFFTKVLDMCKPLQYARFDLGTDVIADMSQLDLIYSNEKKPADLLPGLSDQVTADLKKRPWNQ
jgi:multiple sugar transport system substrate-binding protein